MLLNIEIAKGLDLGNAAALNAKAASIATNANDKTVNATLASLFFAIGVNDKTRNATLDIAPVFAAFAAVHYGPTSGRKLNDKSAIAYRSCFGAYYEAGRAPYDASPVAEFALSELKGSFTKRGAVIRAILTAHPTTCPTVAEMKALVPADVPDTARGMGEDLQSRAAKSFGQSGTFLSACITNPALNLKRLDMLAAIDDFVGALPANVTAEGESYADEAAKLRASLKPKKK